MGVFLRLRSRLMLRLLLKVVVNVCRSSAVPA
jgi:hypothetical protein